MPIYISYGGINGILSPKSILARISNVGFFLGSYACERFKRQECSIVNDMINPASILAQVTETWPVVKQLVKGLVYETLFYGLECQMLT